MFKSIITLFVSFIISIGFSQSEGSFTLKQAQEYAIQNNIQAKLSVKEIAISKQNVKQILGAAYPQISGDVNFQHFIDIPVQLAPADAFAFPDWINQTVGAAATQYGIPIPPATGDEFSEFQFGTKFNANAGITINQILFDGAVFAGIKAAKQYVEFLDMTVERTEKDIKDAVSMSYFSSLIAAENAQLMDENIENLKKIVSESTAYNEQGFLEDLELEQLTFNLNNLKIQKESIVKQNELAQALLKFQMGYNISDEINLTDNLESLVFEKENGVVFLTKDPNIENHISFRMLDAQESLLEINLRADKSNVYPKFYGFFNHQQNTYQNEIGKLGDKWFPTTLWGLKLQVPIFSGFMQKAVINKSLIEIEKVQLQKELTKQSLSLEAIQAKTNYKSALDQFAQQKLSVALAKKIKMKTEIKFKEGLSSSIELTQVQNQLLSTQRNYLNSVFQLLNAKVKIESILN